MALINIIVITSIITDVNICTTTVVVIIVSPCVIVIFAEGVLHKIMFIASATSDHLPWQST